MGTAIKSSIARIGGALRPPVFKNGEESHSTPRRDVARIMAAYDLLPDGVSIHRTNGRTISVSEKMELLFAADKPDLVGDGFVEKINIQDRVGVLHSISQAAQGKKSQPVQFRLKAPVPAPGFQGERWYEARCAAVDIEMDDAVGPAVMLVAREITAERNENAAIEEKLESVNSANRAKSAFLSAMSHELRTPLNAIMGFSDILAGNAPMEITADKRKEYAEIIGSSAEHLLGVLNRILDISKIEAGKYQLFPESFDLEEVMRSALELMNPVAREANVGLYIDISSDLAPLTADKGAIRQVLINLLANAVKFSKPETSVLLKAFREGNQIKISVSDRGIGMDRETLGRLGETFYQADNGLSRQHEGSGLGLSIVFGLVRLHDGEVDVDSAPGKGTTVTVSIPLVSAQSVPVPADPESDITYFHQAEDVRGTVPLKLARKLK